MGGTADEVFVVSDHPDFTDEPRTTLKIASEAADGYGGVSGRVYLCETVDAILDGRPPGISGNDGLKALEGCGSDLRLRGEGKGHRIGKRRRLNSQDIVKLKRNSRFLVSQPAVPFLLRNDAPPDYSPSDQDQ